MNIIDYVKTNLQTFEESPFNPVDSLVLCQLAYVKLEVQDGRPVCRPLRDYYRAEYYSRMFSDAITDPENYELFSRACASPRFRDLPVCHIEAQADPGRDLQFAAMTFRLEPDLCYVAFRGTDGTIAGWKEDFKMAYTDVVPSQEEALRYLERHFGPGTGGETDLLYVGGHSKGGNLACYSSLQCDPSIRARIRRIYSLDGPGFRDEVLERLTAVREEENIPLIRIVPRTSVIGMLLGSNAGQEVVESDAIGILQHSAYTWVVDGTDFIYRKDLSTSGEYLDRTIHNWLLEQSDERRELFVTTIFGILEQNGLDKFRDLKKLQSSDISALLDSVIDIDRESRRTIGRILRSLAKQAVLQIPESVRADRS